MTGKNPLMVIPADCGLAATAAILRKAVADFGQDATLDALDFYRNDSLDWADDAFIVHKGDPVVKSELKDIVWKMFDACVHFVTNDCQDDGFNERTRPLRRYAAKLLEVNRVPPDTKEIPLYLGTLLTRKEA